ncbi:SH3 domain-containing protein [Pelagibacteraceae bacterium]|jgi:SH3-like domain-containing protein|nr:SH3 domain-containing protein [Pelagibacteraceae bacterium]|tara:strand:- start:1234 stop:1674 length:441 start_codon:yes stop_codon:yes gene_type:complete
MFKKIIIFYLFLITSAFANDEYFLTLRNDIVNLRQGPSFEYPIKIFYKKKFLPVLILDKSSNFRKIKDHENNSGWIHVSQLSKKKAGIIIEDNILVFKRSTIYSKPLLILEKGRLCLIKNCKGNWCKVKIGKYVGWVKKESLWGRL